MYSPIIPMASNWTPPNKQIRNTKAAKPLGALPQNNFSNNI
jgi:hypothetical protein